MDDDNDETDQDGGDGHDKRNDEEKEGEDGDEGEDEGKMIRLIAVPRFKETGQIVLLDLATLEVEMLQIEIF